MAIDVARLGIQVDSRGAVSATQDLDDLGKQAQITETQVVGGATRSGKAITPLAGRFAKLGIEGRNAQNGLRMLPFQLNQIAQSGAVTGMWMTSITTQIPDILAGFGSMRLVLLGGAAAMAAAFLPALISTSGQTKRFEENIEELRASMDRYKQASDLATMSTADLEAKFGSASAGIRSTIEELERISRIQVQDNIDKTMQGIAEKMAIRGDGDKRAGIANFFDLNIFGGFKKATKEASNEARILSGEFLNQQRALEAAKGDLDSQIAILERMVDTVEELSSARDGVSEKELALKKSLVDNLLAMQEQKAAVEDTERALDKATLQLIQQSKLYGETRVEGERLSKISADAVVGYQKQADLANAISILGADSALAETIKRDAARDAAIEFTKQEGLTGSLAANVVEAAMAAYDAEVRAANTANNLREAENQARLLASALSSAAGFSLSLDNSIDVLEAEISAARAGADAAIAGQIERDKIRAESNRQKLIEAGQDRTIADAQYAIDMAQIARKQELLEIKGAELDVQKELSRISKQDSPAVQEAKSILSSTRTLEKYKAVLAEVNRLHDEGEISTQSYNAALEVLDERYKDVLDNTSLLGDHTEDLKESILDFAAEGVNSFGDLAQSIKRAAWELFLFGNQKNGGDWGGLLGGIFGGGGGGLFAGLFDSGGNIPSGKVGIAGEYGPELIRGPAHVTSRVDTARMMQGMGGANGKVTVRVLVDDQGNFRAIAEDVAGPVAAEVVRVGLDRYDRDLPDKMESYLNDPEAR